MIGISALKPANMLRYHLRTVHLERLFKQFVSFFDDAIFVLPPARYPVTIVSTPEIT